MGDAVPRCCIGYFIIQNANHKDLYHSYIATISSRANCTKRCDQQCYDCLLCNIISDLPSENQHSLHL